MVQFQMDMHNPFLQVDLLEDIYMTIPNGFARQGRMEKCISFDKSLYELKQASRQWNLKLTKALCYIGFVQSHYDYS